MSESYDAVVIGAGPAGEVAAYRLQEQGMRVALAEKELIGGECAYWGCIPSKTLLRPPEAQAEARRAAGITEPEQRWAEISKYRDFMIRGLDDSKQVSGYEESGVSVFKGEATIRGPGRVEANGQVLETERIIIATGSDSTTPPIPGLAEAGYWTNREATTMTEVPSSVVILGGGPAGIELGQMFRRYGSDVTLVEAETRLIAREEPAVGELIAEVLGEEGIDLRLGVRANKVSVENGRRNVGLEDGTAASGDELLLAVGRRPSVEGLGLETVGIEPGEHGGIPVDERCRAGEGVWAIGDVTAVMPFTHVGKYQARVVCADIAGKPVRADYGAIPRVVFSDPEIAAVGLLEEQARSEGLDVTTARVNLPETIARPWTYQQNPSGDLGLVADRKRGVLVGAWAVSPLAAEWIHQAALAVKTATPLEVLKDTVAQFPTFSEAYLVAVEQLESP